MDAWEQLHARYAQQVKQRQSRRTEEELRSLLQQQYSAWADVTVAAVLEDLSRALHQRSKGFEAHSGVAFLVNGPEPVWLAGTPMAALRITLWESAVYVYAQRSAHSPPAVHLLRQSGGQRSPRMACLPGAWLAKSGDTAYALRHFDAEGSAMSLDELAALTVSLLLGASGRS
jgi:hypothetical protein